MNNTLMKSFFAPCLFGGQLGVLLLLLEQGDVSVLL